MKKSVLIDCERLKYPNSGLANVCRSLILGLEKYSSQLDFSFYAPQKYFTGNPVQLLPWKIWQKFFPVSTKKFQLIHVTHQLSEYFHKKGNQQKKVVTLHDLNFLHENLSPQKTKKRLALVQKNIGNADVIVCISEFVKKDFLIHQHLFSLKKDYKLEVVYNGLLFPEIKIYHSERFTEFTKKKYLLNIGVLFPKKNQLVLLDLLSKTQLDLVLISSAAKEDYLKLFKEKVKQLGLEKRVHLLSGVTEEEKFFFLQNCESYLHPSLAEGFGIPPIEAMYFGKPVFLSRETSLPEIGGELAFYFEDFSAETMQNTYEENMSLYKNYEAEYSKKLHLHALQFHAEKMAKHYLEIYEFLLNFTS